MKEHKVGYISNYFSKLSVAVIELTDGSLKAGDTIHIRGHTTDLKETADSMQIDHAPVPEAKAGDSIGLKVSQKVRRKDKVYKVVED